MSGLPAPRSPLGIDEEEEAIFGLCDHLNSGAATLNESVSGDPLQDVCKLRNIPGHYTRSLTFWLVADTVSAGLAGGHLFLIQLA